MEDNQTTPNTPPVRRTQHIMLLVGALLVIAAGVYFVTTKEKDESQENSFSLSTDAAIVVPEHPDVVATVDGMPVGSNEYVLAYKQNAQFALQQGASLDDPAVQSAVSTQVIDVLINTKLLLNAAAEAGITASDEEVSAAYDELETGLGGAEAFGDMVAQLGLTTEEVRDDVREQLLIDGYLAQNATVNDVTITQADVEAAYNELAATATELPSLEEIYAPLEQQLRQQAQQTAIDALLETLRAEATIEVLI